MPLTGNKKKEYDKNWAKKHRASIRKYNQALRTRAIAKLGGKCVNCGCDNPQAIEFNHINGGGNKEYKETGACRKQFYLDIIADRRTDIDLRCKVCNSLHCLVELKGLENRWKVIYQ